MRRKAAKESTEELNGKVSGTGILLCLPEHNLTRLRNNTQQSMKHKIQPQALAVRAAEKDLLPFHTTPRMSLRGLATMTVD